MGDTFIEQMVRKQATGPDILKKIGVALAAALICGLVSPFILSQFGSFAMILCVGVIWFAFRVITSFNVEYEYIVTNGELDVDKIMAKRSRKRLLTVKFSSFKTFELFKPEQLQGGFNAKIIACENQTLPNTYSATFNHPKFGECILVFTPEQRIIDEVNKYKPRRVVNSSN